MSDYKTFEEKTSFLMEGLNRPLGEEIYKESRVMSSRGFNKTMKFYENELNILYEKIRVMQEVTAFAKTYIIEEVQKRRESLEETLRFIEDSRDSLKEDGYIIKPVSFSDGWNETLKDRDGQLMDRCSVVNGTLAVSGQEVEDIAFSSVSKKQEQTAYYSNVKAIEEKDIYRSFYILDGPATNGISEEFTIMFDGLKRVSMINVQSVNSDLDAVYIINEQGIEEQIYGEVSAGMAVKLATGMKFIVTDRTHHQVTYEIDNQRISSGFWNKVSERELALASGKEFTFDMERETGVAQYKADYAAYQSALAAWSAAKEAVDASNASKASSYQQAYSSYVNEKSHIDSSYANQLSSYHKEYGSSGTNLISVADDLLKIQMSGIA